MRRTIPQAPVIADETSSPTLTLAFGGCRDAL
jgi:hypothetical protein